MGEVTAAKQRYSRGNPPELFPDAILLGSADCVRAGENVEGILPWSLAENRVEQWGRITDGLAFKFNAGINCSGTEQFGQAGDAFTTVVLSAPRRVRITLAGRFTRAIGDNGITLASTASVGSCSLTGPQDGSACDMTDLSQIFELVLQPGPAEWHLQTIDTTNSLDATGFASIVVEWPDGEPGNTNEYVDGFDARCYLPPLMPVLPPSPRPDPYSRRDWLRFCEFIVLTYDDMTAAAAAVQAYFGGTATIATVDNTASVIPGSLIAWNADFSVVIIPGTTNFQQICLQVLDPGIGLVNWGAYSAPTIWQAAYAAIQLRIAATGVDPTGPIFIAGHSYGGAVATLLAANYRLFNSTRDVRLFTIGAPRAGDSRLATILNTVNRVHLANSNDGVTGIPPVAGELTGLSWVLPTLLYNQWTASSKMGEQLALNPAGQVIATDDSQLNYAALVDLIIEIVNSLAIPPYVAHFAAEYVRRIKLNLGD